MTDFQFRLWVYLITYVDDFGRGSADPEIIKGFVLPRRKGIERDDIRSSLLCLERLGCITLYEIGGEEFFYFPNWGIYQRIQIKRSKFPEPPTVSHGEPPSESNPNPNPNPNQNPNPESESEPAQSAILESDSWKCFVDFRKSIKAPVSKKALCLALEELEALAPNDTLLQQKIIDQSIYRGWKGFYPLSEEQSKSAKKQAAPVERDDFADMRAKVLAFQSTQNVDFSAPKAVSTQNDDSGSGEKISTQNDDNDNKKGGEGLAKQKN